MDDAMVTYARLRAILDQPRSAAAKQAGISTDRAKSFETDPAYDDAVEEARQLDNVDELCTLARRNIRDALSGDNRDLPEHTRLQISKWVLERQDPDFMPHEHRPSETQDETKLEEFSKDELRKAIEAVEETEEEVVLDVDG